MNDMTEILETRGEYRVSITPDDYPEPPDWDGQGTIVSIDRYDTPTAVHVWHPSKGDDFGLAELWERWHDMALIERYLRIWHGVVGFDYFDTRDGKFVCIVTEADLREWGFKDLDDYRRAAAKHDFDPNPAISNLNAWRDWTEGEVYYWTIEQRAHDPFTVIDWTGSYDDDAAGEDEEGAWETVEQVHGYYGHTDATEQALEAFSGYVSDTEEVPA